MTKNETCPWCGDSMVEKVKSIMPISVDGDRHCQNCGAQWAPPMPMAVGVLFLFFTGIFTLGGVGLVIAAIVPGSDMDAVDRIRGLLLGGAVAAITGFGAYMSLNVVRGKHRTPKIYTPGREDLMNPDVLPVTELDERTWLKIRIMDKDVPMYSTPSKDAGPIEVLSNQPVAEVASVKGMSDWVEVAFQDGRHGYLYDVTSLSMTLFSLEAQTTPVMAEASKDAPVLVNLPQGARLEQYGEAVATDNGQWIPVLLSDGRTGYLNGNANIINLGMQLRIQDSPNKPGTRKAINGMKVTPLD